MALKYVLLTLLQKEPQTGYQIVQSFETAIGYFWSASHQQVYRELGNLSNAGHVSAQLIQQKDKPDKKIYSIKSSGVVELTNWLEAPAKKTATKDPLLVKLLNASSENYEAMVSELQAINEQSKGLYKIYQGIEDAYYSDDQRKALPTTDMVLYIALRKGILGIQAQMKWHLEAISLLKEMFE